MNNNRNITENILGLFGIYYFVDIVHHAYKTLDTKTETTVISDDAIRVIQDPKTASKLRDVVDDYHEKGEWDEKELEAIL